jgi:hypothetical protein
VTDLVAQGIWTPQRAEAALDDMDPDSHTSRDVAGEEEIERICENMLDDGKYEGPEPTMDLTQALLLGSQYLSEARNDGVPAKHIDLLYRFLDDVVALQGQIAGPTPPPALGGAGAPGGPSPAPGAPPGAPAPPAAAPPPA